MGISYVQIFLQVVLVPEDHAGTRKGDGRAGSHISYFATISLTPTRGGETSSRARGVTHAGHGTRETLRGDSLEQISVFAWLCTQATADQPSGRCMS